MMQLTLTGGLVVVCSGINCGEVIGEAGPSDRPDDRSYCEACSVTVCMECGRQGCLCNEYIDEDGFIAEVIR